MDPAQERILAALRHQKPMNDVIDQGDSPVQQFYKDATVFVTGGSGFVGKQLIEKLFRSCAIKKMYVLLRSKKGKTIQDRLNIMLNDPVYDLVRDKKPQFADKIVPLEGNLMHIKLGLSEEDWNKLTQEVTAIFHAAATIRFEEPLRAATFTNVRATRDSLILAKQCSHLKSYVYVSTAYTTATENNIGKDVYEEFYPAPILPDLLISLAEELDEDKLKNITKDFIQGWVNTYIFTKATAEELIRTTTMDLPICIVRPPIVVPAYYEPSPGWLDISAITGTSGSVLKGYKTGTQNSNTILKIFHNLTNVFVQRANNYGVWLKIALAVILGVLHVFRASNDCLLPKTPVDYVNNAIIAAGWDAQQRRNTGDNKIPIYTVSNKEYFITLGFKGKVFREGMHMSTDKAIYMCGMIECKNYFLYWILAWLFHYIPAYIADGCCAILGKRPEGIKSFVDIYSKIDKMSTLYDYFLSNHWGFRDDNVRDMLSKMSDADKAIYNCDLSTIDFTEYVAISGIGIRKYIIKDGLDKSELGSKKQKVFTVINYVLLTVYAYVIWVILMFGYSSVKYLLNIGNV